MPTNSPSETFEGDAFEDVDLLAGQLARKTHPEIAVERQVV